METKPTKSKKLPQKIKDLNAYRSPD